MVLHQTEVSGHWLMKGLQLRDIRPGLKPFLQRITQLYELHVYTMGTRSYANAVCEAIDPTGEFFADRILSRDENSSTPPSHQLVRELR